MPSSRAAGRKTGARRWWLVVPGFLLLLLAAGFLFRQPIGRYLLARTMATLGTALQGCVTSEQVLGDVLSRPRLTGVRVVAGRDSARIEEVEIEYDLLALVQGRIALAHVRVRELRVWVSAERLASPADTARLRFPNLSIGRLELDGGRVWLNGEIRADSLRLELALRSNPTGMSLDLSALRGRLTKEGVVIHDVAARARLTSDSLAIDSLKVRTVASRFSGSGRVAFRPGGAAVQVDDLSLDLAELRAGPGRVWLKGSARTGDSALAAQTEYVAEGMRWRGVDLPRLSGDAVLVDSTVRLRFSGSDAQLGAADVSARLRLGSYAVSGTARVSDLAVREFDSLLPDFRLSARLDFTGGLGSLRRPAGDDSLEVLLSGSVRGLGIDTVDAGVGYTTGAVELRTLRLLGPAGALQFTGRAREGLVAAECRMDSLDVSLASRFTDLAAAGRMSGRVTVTALPDSWALQGRLNGESLSLGDVRLARAALDANLYVGADYRGRIAVGGEGISAAGLRLDAAQFIWTGPEFNLRLEWPQNRLRLEGDVAVRRRGLDCTVSAAELASAAETLAAGQPFQIDWHGDSLVVGRVHLNVADGTADVAAVLRPGAWPRLDARGRGLNLRKLQKLLRLETEVWGLVDLDVEGDDTLRVALAGTDVQLPGPGIQLKRLEVAAALSAARLRLDYVRFVHRVDTTTLGGWVEYSVSPRVTVSGMDLTARVRDPGAWVFAFLRGVLDVSEAQVYGDVTLRGTPGEPVLAGRARVVQAELYSPHAHALVSHANAELTFDRDRVVLDKLSGESGRGTVIANGLADLGPHFVPDSVSYRIRCSGASASPMADVYAIGGGDLLLRWAPLRPVELTGDVDVEEAVVTMGFGGSSVPPAPVNDSFVYDLKVRADHGVWLRNRDADIEMSVDLVLRRTMAEQTWAGRLESRQGSVYYLDQTLRVTRGVLSFENISGFNPELDIAAELPVRGADNSGRERPEKITLTLTGTLAEPKFTLGSDPPVWDESQIAGYLSFRVPVDELPPLEQKDVITRLLSERLLGYFQTQVSKKVRDFVALDYLEIESGLGTGQGAAVTVGKYIGRKLYVSYSQSFSADADPAFTVEYYLNRQNEILAERSAGGVYSLRYRFKLRY